MADVQLVWMACKEHDSILYLMIIIQLLWSIYSSIVGLKVGNISKGSPRSRMM